MTVLVRHRAEGLTMDDYDKMSPPLVALVKQQPGFILHVAFQDSKGPCVAELWETKEAHDRFFDEHVAPNIPAEIAQEVIEVHNVVQP